MEEGAGRAGGRSDREAGGANGCHARMQNTITSPGPDACMHVCMQAFVYKCIHVPSIKFFIAFQFQVLTLSDSSPNACVYVSMCLQFLFHSLIPDGT